MFPVDTAFFGGSASLKFDSNTLERFLLERIAGATKATSGGTDTYTIGKTSKPEYCKVQLLTEDTEGRAVVVTFYKAVAPALPFRFKMDDFVDTAVEFEGYPSADDDDKVVDIALAQSA
jgi:hypothetical protein